MGKILRGFPTQNKIFSPFPTALNLLIFMKNIMAFQTLQTLILVVMFIVASSFYELGHDIIYLVYGLLFYGALVFFISLVSSIFFYNYIIDNKKGFYAINIIVSLLSFNFVTNNSIFDLLGTGFSNVDFYSIVVCLVFVSSIVVAIVCFPFMSNIFKTKNLDDNEL